MVEATYGWYWVADVLAECGAELHLAHPLGMKGITSRRRVKNDVKDVALLADLLRLGSLPEAWVVPPELRELRELVRYRMKLVQVRSGLKQVHAAMAKEHVLPERTDMFGPGGQAQLDEMRLGDAYRIRIVMTGPELGEATAEADSAATTPRTGRLGGLPQPGCR